MSPCSMTDKTGGLVNEAYISNPIVFFLFVFFERIAWRFKKEKLRMLFYHHGI